MQKMNIHPDLSSIEAATAFFEEILTQNDVPSKAVMQVNIAVDEIFSNITISAPWPTMDDAWAAAETAGMAEDIHAMPMGCSR